jgi:hypothetical protein
MAATTIKVKPDTKDRLKSLKEMFGCEDYDATVSRLIDFIPEKLSTDEQVTIVMTMQKFNWVKSRQSCSDVTNFLIQSVR